MHRKGIREEVKGRQVGKIILEKREREILEPEAENGGKTRHSKRSHRGEIRMN